MFSWFKRRVVNLDIETSKFIPGPTGPTGAQGATGPSGPPATVDQIRFIVEEVLKEKLKPTVFKK